MNARYEEYQKITENHVNSFYSEMTYPPMVLDYMNYDWRIVLNLTGSVNVPNGIKLSFVFNQTIILDEEVTNTNDNSTSTSCIQFISNDIDVSLTVKC